MKNRHPSRAPELFQGAHTVQRSLHKVSPSTADPGLRPPSSRRTRHRAQGTARYYYSIPGNTPLYCTSSGYSLLPLMYICTQPLHYTCYVHFVAEKTATFPCMSLWLLSGAGWFVLLLLHCHPLSFVGA